MTPELRAQIHIWREKSAAGTLTMDECREAIAILRDGRFAAATAVKEQKKESKKANEQTQIALDDI